MSDQEQPKRSVFHRSSPPEPSLPLEPTFVDRGPEIVATTLAPQLGSDSLTLAKGKIDMILLSVLEPEDKPLLLYAAIRAKKSKAWALIFDLYPKLTVGQGGRGRRDIIRMEGVSKGGMPSVESEMDHQRPGVLARNLWDRSWKNKVEDTSV